MLFLTYALSLSRGGGGGGGGGGSTLIFSCMRRLGLFFGGFKILNFIIFWGFPKNKYFFWGGGV